MKTTVAYFYLFNIFDVQVDGPADVTTTSGMPDAERKERQVLCFAEFC